MMKAMRRNYKAILWVIAILIIPAFIWWGAGTSNQQGPASGYAGQIEKWKVPLEEYTSVYQSLRQNLSSLFGASLTEEILDDLTWTRLLLFHEAKKRKIQASDEEIKNRIAELPHFQKDGRFDPAGYQQALGNRARQFEEQIRRELVINRLRETITSSVTASEEEIRNAFAQENEKIQLGYTLIEEKIPPPETQPNPYGTSLQAEPSVETEQAREKAKTSAEQLHQEVQKKIEQAIPIKEAFGQVSSSVILTDSIGRQTSLEKIGYQPSFLEKAFQTPEGQLGQVIEIPEGFVLYWVEKKIPLDEQKLESEKSDHRQRVLDQKKTEAFNNWLTEVKTNTPIKNYLADLKN